ncbi:hypothetical protein [Streptomyces sp. NPDC048332]|uniref:hypothetical protein n=1 Tax=Streptomyces sp. NPDC048332 TaxID=3154619 RepID=UPI00343458FC
MRRLLWLSAAAVLAAGCSTAPGGEAVAERLPDPRPLGGVLDPTAAEYTALHRAEELEVRTCMESRGFDYEVRPVGDVRRKAAESPYGLLTRSRAGQDGYGLTAERLRKPTADPNARRVSTLAARDRRAWEEALKGAADGPREQIELPDGPTVSVPTDSCVTAASRALYGTSWYRNRLALQNLRNSIVADTLDHPLVKSAEQKWSACMRDEGFRYEDRQVPVKALHERLAAAGSDPAALRATGREELRIAVRDAACQARTGLAEQVLRAQKQVEKALPAARTSMLNAFRTARRAALERAETADTADTARQAAASPS